MIVKINGEVIQQPEMVEIPVYMIDEKLEKIEKVGKRLIPISLATGLMNVSKPTFAQTSIETSATVGDAIMPILTLIQDIAFPVSIIVASWGLIEVMIGQPIGKEKIKHSIIGFIGIYVIPTLFKTIRTAFAGL